MIVSRVLPVVSTLFLSIPVYAQTTYDTSAAESAINAAGTAVAAIGGAFLVVAIGKKVWAMLRR